MALTLAEANRVLEGAIAKAKELNIKISVAVCDAWRPSGGLQPDGWGDLGGVYGSQGKAVASVAFARPSGRAGGAGRHPDHSRHRAAEGGHMIPSQGAVPSSAMAWPKALAASAAAPARKMKTAPRRAPPSSNPPRPLPRSPLPLGEGPSP